MTREEALRYWEWKLERAEEWSDPHWEASERKAHKEYVDAMKTVIEALRNCSEKPNGSLISRQDAIDVIMGEPTDAHYPSWYADKINALPSADRPTGEWMLEEYKSRNHIENFYICSSCRNFEAWGKTELYNYCPNCGAKMRGDDE